jgi:hypothetical protein
MTWPTGFGQVGRRVVSAPNDEAVTGIQGASGRDQAKGEYRGMCRVSGGHLKGLVAIAAKNRGEAALGLGETLMRLIRTGLATAQREKAGGQLVGRSAIRAGGRWKVIERRAGELVPAVLAGVDSSLF